MGKKHITLEARVRPIRELGTEQALMRLFKLRGEVTPDEFGRLIDAYRNVGRKGQTSLTRPLQSYSDLYWLPSAKPLTLHDELAWASEFLAPITRILSAHAKRAFAVNELLETASFTEIVALAEQSIEANGWSCWAVNLKLAALFASGNAAQASEYSEELQRIGAGRISGLLARIVSDRNDGSVPFASFEARCKDFFARTSDPSRLALYKTRAMAQTENQEHYLRVLAFDALSSYVDYYETIIDAAQLEFDDADGMDGFTAIAKCLSGLHLKGLEDVRIRNICAERRWPELDAGLVNNAQSFVERCDQIGSPYALSDSGWLAKINNCISLADTSGLIADDQVEELLRAGLNFHSLTAGKALWRKGIQPFVSLEELPLFLGSDCLSSYAPSKFALLSKKDEEVERALVAMNGSRARSFTQCLSSGGAVPRPVPDAYDVWLCRSLIRRGHSSQALELASAIRSAGGAWDRYGAQLEILGFAARGDLALALRECALQIVDDVRKAYELPLEYLISKRKWIELKGQPAWLVAIVAHFSNHVVSSSKVRFLCRMACRDLYKQMHAVGIQAFIETLAPVDKKLVCSFLAKGWVDENLSMIEEMVSSQDVRKERLGVFQILLAIDDENADDYKRVIQELTLDETLWSGLRDLDSNRVFVNQPAITRWAEKELGPEFERWKALRLAEGAANSKLDQMLRNYLLDHDLDALLSSLPDRQQSEAGAVILGVLVRLFSRFLTDPANGLNSYLSLRIRHGTLRGVLLGPIEEERLLLSGEFSDEEFSKRWSPLIKLAGDDLVALREELAKFGRSMDALATWIVGERVQIWSPGKPQGMFASVLDTRNAQVLFETLDPTVSFRFFLNQCYIAFWEVLLPSRTSIAEFMLGEVSTKVQDHFRDLIGAVTDRFGADSVRPLLISLQALATRSIESCRVIADWFLPVSEAKERTYSVESALEIAKKATSNVYREFHPELHLSGENCAEMALSVSGLAVLYDSLFVVFGNAWVHSGLSVELRTLWIQYRYIPETQVFYLRAENELSVDRCRALRSGELEALKEKYMADIPLDLVPVEGGSGFAKLARIVATVDRNNIDRPLNFGIDTQDRFFVELHIQLYERDGVFDAYL